MTELVLALVAAPLVVGLVFVCLREPMRVALPIYATLLPFGGGLAVGSSRFGSLSSLMGLVLGAGLVLQFVGSRRGAVHLSPTIPVWLLFLGTAGITTLWSLTPDSTLSGFVVLGSLVVVYVLVAMSHADRVVLRRTEDGLLFGGVVATCYGLFQLFVLGGFPSDVPGEGIVSDGRFGNDLLGPNNEAVALLIPLVIALTRSVSLPARSQRFAHVLISAVLLLGILMTGSRGGALATLVAVAVLVVTVPRGRAALLRYGAVGIAALALVLLFHPAGIAERNVDATSSSGRTDIWKVGLAACPRYCAVGAGWGSFPAVYAETQASVPDAKVLVGRGGSYEPHNVWLLIAIELGLPGLLLFGAALWLTFVEALRLPAGLRAPPMSAFLTTVVAALFLSNLEFKFFWMPLILIALSRNLADSEARPATPLAIATSATVGAR